jgi:hypothetical protein
MTGNTPLSARHPRPDPLDWNQAVCLAAGRLGKLFVTSSTIGPELPPDAVQTLAALVCAYGCLAAEAERARTRPAAWPLQRHRQPARSTPDRPRPPPGLGLPKAR